MTVYSPKGANTGAAVIVFPGGGYQILAIDLEGTEICDWLTSRGITAVLLKYRVPNHGPSWDQESGYDRDTRSSMALEDAQRAISLVRHHAAKWHLDPRKIGVIGFSAGGHLVAAVSTRFGHRVYPPVDEADRESCRPDFALALYPGHMLQYRHPAQHKDLRIPRDTPPTFIVQAENDNVDSVSNSLVYYDVLKNAGVPVELHLYAEGGHAFALRPTKKAITGWPRLAETWLHTIGILSK
jgi:acetyl esterase/lipase